MSCPGLHCPGCSDGQTLGLAGGLVLGLVVLDRAVPWVAARVWWIGGTLAVCFALAVAAGTWLERWNDRKAAAWGAARGILSRADVVSVPAVKNVPPGGTSLTPGPGRRALPVPQVVNINFFGVPDAEQAAIIRQALPAHAVDTRAQP